VIARGAGERVARTCPAFAEAPSEVEGEVEGALAREDRYIYVRPETDVSVVPQLNFVVTGCENRAPAAERRDGKARHGSAGKVEGKAIRVPSGTALRRHRIGRGRPRLHRESLNTAATAPGTTCIRTVR
jgi:hypothetical protein